MHERLQTALERHMRGEFKKPIIAHTRLAFEEADRFVISRGKPVVLDSGCGTGESTIFLAEQYPDHTIIGIEKSALRLQKAIKKQRPENLLWLRADQFDFWRLAAESDWQIDAHYLFYPNPWPKKAHLHRRVHGHPSFPQFARLAPYIEARSNWRIYLEELAFALHFVAARTVYIEELFGTPITLFEKKYRESGQTLYCMVSQLEPTA